MQLAIVRAQHLRRHLDHVARAKLVQEGDVRLGGEVGAAAAEILAVDAEVPKHRVCAIRHHLEISALCHVPVVVHPFSGDASAVKTQRPGEVITFGHDTRVRHVEQRALVLGEDSAGARSLRPQALQHGDERVVA